MTHVLTIRKKGSKDGTEIHVLNPGESFPNFGGGEQSLVAKKTASIVTRARYSGTLSDTENNIYDANTWEWLARLINDKDKDSDIVAERPV